VAERSAGDEDDAALCLGNRRGASGIHDAAMLSTPDNPFDDTKVRAARYRARAEEVRKRAVSIKWAEVRANLLQAAENYDALAQTIEDIAEKQARSWTPQEG
jgi:hypothetical protein